MVLVMITAFEFFLFLKTPSLQSIVSVRSKVFLEKQYLELEFYNDARNSRWGIKSSPFSCRLQEFVEFSSRFLITSSFFFSQSRKLQENGWTPRWFRREGDDGPYRYIGGYWEARDQKKWEGCPNIFGEV